MFNINVCYDDFIDSYPILQYSSPIIPKIGEIIYSPHKGSFMIKDIVYHISDDREGFDNKVLFVELKVEER